MKSQASARPANELGATVAYAAERLITLREVSSRCGLSARMIYKLLAAKRFGPELVRVGRAVRFVESEFNAWLRAGCPDREAFQALCAADVER